MNLSYQKPLSKFNKSLDISKFGRPVRSPRTPSTSLQSYSDTFEGTSQWMPNYSDSFESESDKYTPRSKTGNSKTAKVPAERTENISTEKLETLQTEQPDTIQTERLDTIHTERPATAFSDYMETEYPRTVTVGIETCISELETDQIRTVTERIVSQDSDTEKLHTRSSRSNLYSYSDTFQSSQPSEDQYEDDFTFSKSDETVTRSCYTDSHTIDYSRTTVSDTMTQDKTQSSVFQEYTLSSEVTSEREYSSEFEEDSEITQSYSSEFESDSQDTEKQHRLQREEEERKLTVEAQENFISTLISNIKQQPFKAMDIEELIDKEIQDVEEKEDMSSEKMRYLRRKLHILKKKQKKGDPEPAPEINKWDTQKTERITDYGLHPSILERLKLRNFIDTMEMAAKEDFHDPKKCKECRKHAETIDAAAAERNFIRMKTRDTRQRVMEEQYHKHLVKMDSINLIADIARSLPRHSDDPQDIEDQLFKGLQLSKSIVQNRINGV